MTTEFEKDQMKKTIDNALEEQPKPPQYIVAVKIEFDDEMHPNVLYQVRGRGTMIECHVMAEKIPDVTYNGNRVVKSAQVVVVLAPEIDEQLLEN